VQVSKQGCMSITSWQHLTWHFMTPARHTKLFCYCYFNYFRHVAMLQKFAGPLVGAPFLWGPLFSRTCWTCLNPPLPYSSWGACSFSSTWKTPRKTIYSLQVVILHRLQVQQLIMHQVQSVR